MFTVFDVVSIDRPEPGWVSFEAPAEFPGEVAVRVQYLKGAPRVVELRYGPGRLGPNEGALTQATLARIPLRDLANAAARCLGLKPDGSVNPPYLASNYDNGWMSAMWRPEPPPERPRGGSGTFSGWVADLYEQSKAQGRSARDEIANAAHVSAKRADQMIREARDGGYLPEDETRRRRNTTGRVEPELPRTSPRGRGRIGHGT